MKGVLLDFVGTLVGIRADRDAGLQRVRRELQGMGARVGIKELEDAYLKARESYSETMRERLVEVSSETWIRDAMGLLGLEEYAVGDSVRTLTSAYFDSYMQDARALRGAEEALRYLSGKGYTIALVSNFSYSPAPEGVLKRLGLYDFFSVMAISQTVGYRKPHPAIFRYALERMGIGPSDAVMVGDTPTEDTYGAKRMGIRAFQMREAMNNHYTPYSPREADIENLRPDRQIDDLLELTHLL